MCKQTLGHKLGEHKGQRRSLSLLPRVNTADPGIRGPLGKWNYPTAQHLPKGDGHKRRTAQGASVGEQVQARVGLRFWGLQGVTVLVQPFEIGSFWFKG